MRLCYRIVLGVVWLALCAAVQSQDQGAARKVALESADRLLRVTVPAQPIETALNEFARQSGLHVVIDSRIARDLNSTAVDGNFKPEQALARMLQSTGLTYRILDGRTISVVKTAATTTSGATDGVTSDRNAALLVQAGPSASDASAGVEEMLVEGEREKPAPFSTANLDLTRTEDDPLPFTVFTARDIELSGSVSLQDFLQSRLTQNFNADIPEEMDSMGISSMDRVNRVNMRGWGAAETIFLLNGRRLGTQFQGAGDDTSNATPNLSAIPLASIERIEILPSAGSAIYGVSATGGVINIITRRDFKGGQFSLNYETPLDAHAPRRGADLNYGSPLGSGFGVRIAAGFNEVQPVQVEDREAVTIGRWRRRALQRQPSLLFAPVAGNPFNTSGQVYGGTPNIRAVTTTGNLFAALPGAQPSNFTSVPAGYSGGGLSAFVPGAYNLGLAPGAAGGNALYAEGSTFGVNSENTTLGIGIDKSWRNGWSWSLDYRYAESDAEGRADGALNFTSSLLLSNRARVPAATPGNPFQQDVRVLLIDPNLDRAELRNKPHGISWEMVSTLRGEIGEWRGFLDMSYSHNRNSFTNARYWEPYGGWYNAFLSGDYNPFVDLRRTSPAAASFYEDYIVQRYVFGSASRNYQSSLKTSGPLSGLPAGALQLTAGVDWLRTDRYQSFYYGQFEDVHSGELRIPVGSTSAIVSPLDVDPQRRFVFDSFGGYAELDAPLVSSAQKVPLIRRLDVIGSGRMSELRRRGFRSQFQGGTPISYDTTAYSYALAFRYEPMQGAALRASRGIGLKPPAMSQVTPGNPPTVDCCFGLFDPMRNNEAVTLTPAMYRQGGNPELKAESTVATNFGFMLMPQWAPGLRVSVDYLEEVRSDAIYYISVQEMIQLESAAPERVRRGPASGGFDAGEIVFVDATAINLNKVTSRSADFSIEQRIENVMGGRVMLAAAASRNFSYKVQPDPSTAPVEQVRNVNAIFSAQQIEWNANAQVRWEGRRWSAGWNLRYFDYVLVLPTDRTLQGSDRAPWRMNHDLNVSFRPLVAAQARGIAGLLSGASVTFGIKNIFDREPRFWAASTERGVAPYDSIMGRSIWLQMRKEFGQ